MLLRLALVFAPDASGAPLDPLVYTSLGNLAPTGTVTVNTDTLTMSGGGVSETGIDVGGVAVFTFDDVDIDTTFNVVGSRPLAILSKTTLDVTASGVID